MHPTRSLRRHGVRCALAIGSLSVIVAVVLGEAAGGDGAKGSDSRKAAKRDAKDAAKMVEAIANRNKPPKIVERQKDYPKWFPLFPANYNWKEEKRVREAIGKLYQDTSTELWEALVQGANDKRYCITSYSGNSADVEIHSVGWICRDLAYSRLCALFEKHLPSLPPHGCPVQFWDIRKDMPAWRKERKDKTLYQLQIEVCEMALRELSKVNVEDVSEKEKTEARKKIEVEIAKLRKTKHPVLEELGNGFFTGAYPRKEAERVREAYEQGFLEKFRSGLNK